ncbi:hypothetical protein PGB90_007762 [Kerria lacca]
MGPLIDAELEKVDRKHAQLTQLSSNLVDALNLYHTLMREPFLSMQSVSDVTYRTSLPIHNLPHPHPIMFNNGNNGNYSLPSGGIIPDQYAQSTLPSVQQPTNIYHLNQQQPHHFIPISTMSLQSNSFHHPNILTNPPPVQITEFAKKTGDYTSLSATDLKLIALTYQLETQNVGNEHLRKSPILQKENLDINFSNKEERLTDEQEAESEDDNDDDGWITSSNLHNLKSATVGSLVEDTTVIVGCLTTDFAIQNVLMQIGLNVVTSDGKVIKELRTYILRCYGCFKTTSNMKKMFCPNCGNKTLKRVSVYLDKNGNKSIFINFKKPISTKGKRFSLPMPESGKHAVNPRLVEDARRPHQKPSKLAKTKTDALQDDYLAGSSPFIMRDVYSRSAQLGFNKGKPVFKYWMKKNPNEPKHIPKK